MVKNLNLRLQHTVTTQKQLDTNVTSGDQMCYEPSYYDPPPLSPASIDDNLITEDDLVFTADEEAKYRRRQEEGYDIETDTRIMHG